MDRTFVDKIFKKIGAFLSVKKKGSEKIDRIITPYERNVGRKSF